MPLLVDYSLLFLNKSWEWLNDPEIQLLTLTPPFTKQDQVNFYDSLPNKKDYWIKGNMENGHPIGAMGLKHITSNEAEYWGYIGERDYWGKGIGSFMLKEATTKAKEFGLQKIYLKVGKQNTRAKQLYSRLGFQIVLTGAIEKYEMNL